MIKYILITVFLLSFNNLFSQDKQTSYNFGDAYYLLTNSDDVNNFYVVDFTKFPSKFEKIYFKNLVYKNKIIVSIDSDLSKNTAKFQANKVYDIAIVKKNFDEIIEKTVNANTTMDAMQKEEWMKKNTK